MIDRNYNKVVLVCYPSGAGGNFLINCLSLTDQCVLRESRLAEQQLKFGLSPLEKTNYFLDQLDQTLINAQWNDLGLGCGNLFGVQVTDYLIHYPEIIQKKFNYIISKLIESNKYLFIVGHSMQHLDAYLKFWPNARVLFLTHYHEFVQRRGYKPTAEIQKLKAYWDIVRGPDWPVSPPINSAEFLQLPANLQQELNETFHGEIFRWIETSPTTQELHDRDIDEYSARMSNNAYQWNVQKNFTGNETVFIDELFECAKWLDIKIDVSEDVILNYYRTWLSVIATVNNNH